MEKIDSEQLDSLAKFQDLEIEMRKLRQQLETEPAILIALAGQCDDKQTQLDECRQRSEELKKEYRSQESDTQLNLDHIKKSQAKLNTVKTNKEYQSLLKEIDEIKKKNSSIEDAMIASLDTIEELEQQIVEHEKDWAELDQQIAEKKAIVEKEREALRLRLTELEGRAGSISDGIHSELMRLYNDIKTKKGGTGIAPVIDAVCQGCHLNIPPQMYNELHRRDSLKNCPWCERIIYWKEG